MTYIAHEQFGKKQAYVITIGDLTLCFSYKTLVGAYYQSKGVRRHNDWGPTTNRHMNSMNLLRDNRVEEVTEAKLVKFVEDAIRDMGISLMHKALMHEPVPANHN